MVSYTMSGGADRSSVANVTVDTPSIIFSLDPLFALLNFASYPFKDSNSSATPQEEAEIQQVTEKVEEREGADDAATGGLAFRVNVVQASVKLLADPTRHDSEAVVLSIRQVQMAQQGTFVLSVDHLGIFLSRMDRPKEIIRILDDFDLNLSMDTRSADGSQSSSIELDVQPLVLRLSNRDVVLVSSIVSRAIELSSTDTKPEQQSKSELRPNKALPPSSAAVSRLSSDKRRRASSAAKPQKAEVLLTKESVRE
jgi:vacuolar protein sorting-associated protein 13A/C